MEQRSSPQAGDSIEPKPQQQRESYDDAAQVHSVRTGGIGRIGVSSGGGGSNPNDGDWQAMLREAIEQESRDDEVSLKGQRVDNDLDDDITEEGWLPK